MRFLDHNPGVGGRFSVLTNVGLLPAAVLGLDIAAVRKGAADAYDPLRAGSSAKDIPAALGAALNIATALEGRNITVTMAYADRLERFTRWWVQLWAESVGKDGKGSQPVAAIGPVDQHSQMQLYLGGPNDKLFTVTDDGRGGTWARDGRKAFEARGRTGLCGQAHRRSCGGTGARDRRHAGARTAVRPAPCIWTSWTSVRSANC